MNKRATVIFAYVAAAGRIYRIEYDSVVRLLKLERSVAGQGAAKSCGPCCKNAVKHVASEYCTNYDVFWISDAH